MQDDNDFEGPRWLWCAALVLVMPLSACSVFSISPAMELLKATGTAATFAVGHAVGSSVDVVRHDAKLPERVCVVLNEQASSADFLTALRRGLTEVQVDHRLVLEPHPALRCEAWLHYATEVDWGAPPLGGKVQAHVVRASLTLRDLGGRVLAQVRFEPSGAFEAGRWASTQDKVQAMVRGLWPDAQTADMATSSGRRS
jgi:hypothetical protein